MPVKLPHFQGFDVLPNESGVYVIVNTLNGKRYVGASINMWWRAGTHMTTLRRNCHSNRHLQADFNAGGRMLSQFRIEVVARCPEAELGREERKARDRMFPVYCILTPSIGRHCRNRGRKPATSAA